MVVLGGPGRPNSQHPAGVVIHDNIFWVVRATTEPEDSHAGPRWISKDRSPKSHAPTLKPDRRKETIHSAQKTKPKTKQETKRQQ